ncbi:hypothetical protein [Micromonospora sp. LH3U1]|uniref:hypothetical protein n=1 Tax=Micromonospora sp. LH3U1 TaxID=3018339 RepID=UPI00234B4A9F|nr:hypothetical protein [Micromonospora sp. LH3U1]WCN83192.1 hypothetical protein PCA76_09140 [Micromonospora sp. LH3U1]
MPSAAVIDLDATADSAPPGTRRWLPALVAVGVLAFAGGAEAAAPLKPSLVLPPDGTVDVRSDGHTVFVRPRPSSLPTRCTAAGSGGPYRSPAPRSSSPPNGAGW